MRCFDAGVLVGNLRLLRRHPLEDLRQLGRLDHQGRGQVLRRVERLPVALGSKVAQLGLQLGEVHPGISLVLGCHRSCQHRPTPPTPAAPQSPNDPARRRLCAVRLRRSGQRERLGAIDDRVMGGISRSRLRHDPAGHAVFEGQVSLERNGGFASVRSSPGARGKPGAAACVIEVRGDGKQFKLSLLTDDGFDSLNYQAGFTPMVTTGRRCGFRWRHSAPASEDARCRAHRRSTPHGSARSG